MGWLGLATRLAAVVINNDPMIALSDTALAPRR